MATVLPQLAGVEHRFVDLPNLRMHVAEAGEGDPVVDQRTPMAGPQESPRGRVMSFAPSTGLYSDRGEAVASAERR